MMITETNEDGSGFEIVEEDTTSSIPRPTVDAVLIPPAPLPSFLNSSTAPLDPIISATNPFAMRPSVAPIIPPQLLSPALNTSPTAPIAPIGGIGGPLTATHSIGLDLPDDTNITPESIEPESKQPTDPAGANISSGVLGWFQKTVNESEFLSKVAEKAKTGMGTMITTLDPQMKDYIRANGSIEMAIASDCDVIISGIKDGFQRVFQHVIARGLGAPGSTMAKFATLPIQFENGRKAAEERVSRLRQSGLVSQQIPIVSVEDVIIETAPNRWFHVSCLLLEDPSKNLQLHVFSQASPLDFNIIQALNRHTPSDYSAKSSGFAISVGQAMAECFGFEPNNWHQQLTGITQREIIGLAAASLAASYSNSINK